MSTESLPPFVDSKIAYTPPEPSPVGIAPLGCFLPPEGLPETLHGHLSGCRSPLSGLNSKGITAFYVDAIENGVAFKKTNHIWVSVLSE